MKSICFCAVMITASLLVPAPLMAASDVKGPLLNPEGTWKIGHKGSWSNDSNDTDLKNRQGYKFGAGNVFAPRWLAEVETGFSRTSDDDLSLSTAEFELQHQFADVGAYWWDTGTRLNYIHRAPSHDADALDVLFMAQNTYRQFTTRINMGLVHDFGKAGQDISVEARGFVRYEYSTLFKPGIEYQAEFGAIDDFASSDQQGHVIGPALYGGLTLPNNKPLAYEVAYLFGLTDSSPDGDLRWKLEYNFRF